VDFGCKLGVPAGHKVLVPLPDSNIHPPQLIRLSKGGRKKKNRKRCER
jgi:hypothetical protein